MVNACLITDLVDGRLLRYKPNAITIESRKREWICFIWPRERLWNWLEMEDDSKARAGLGGGQREKCNPTLRIIYPKEGGNGAG